MTLLHQLWNRVVFAYDFSSLTPDGLLRDFGPLGLHATFPGGVSNPTAQLDGSYVFDGFDWLTLSGTAQARFYANAPTGPYCWLSVGYATTGTPFSTWDGANKGSFMLYVGGRVRGYNNGTSTFTWTAATYLNDTTKRVFSTTIETTPRTFIDAGPDATIWALGVYGAPTYDTTLIPYIGRSPGGAHQLTGRLWYLALLRSVPTTSELIGLNQMMRDGGKPWCVRP